MTIENDRRHNRPGHLYQGRYKSFLIDADFYLKEVSHYIHLNPVRIKKYSGKDVKEKAILLNSYKLSSMRGYSNMKNWESFINYSIVLDYFGGGTGSLSVKDLEKHLKTPWVQEGEPE